MVPVSRGPRDGLIDVDPGGDVGEVRAPFSQTPDHPERGGESTPRQMIGRGQPIIYERGRDSLSF